MMNPNIDTKYTKIEVLINLGTNSIGNSIGTNKEEYLNSSVILSGDYLIISTSNEDDTKTVNKVFSLSQIKAYKMYTK